MAHAPQSQRATLLLRLCAAAAAGAALLAATGCSPTAQPAAEKPTINVYSARHYDADDRLFKAFETATGIKPRVLSMEGPQLLQRLKDEGDQTSADVILMVDAGNLTRLVTENLVQGVQAADLEARVPASLRDPEGRWFGLTKRFRVIAYAKDRVRPDEVATMDALTGARFKGRICARTSTNIYNLSMMAARIAREGAEKAEAWARGVAANFARAPQGNDTDQLRAVAGGVCDVAIVNHYYVVRMQASNDPTDREAGAKIAVAVPDQGEAGIGVHRNISGGAVGRFAKNRDAAIALLTFLASPQAQAEVAALNDEFPIDTQTPVPPALAALGTIKEDPTPMTSYGDRQSQAQSLYERAGWR
jgi:iron(III) transport system substrate-binding protein